MPGRKRGKAENAARKKIPVLVQKDLTKKSAVAALFSCSRIGLRWINRAIRQRGKILAFLFKSLHSIEPWLKILFLTRFGIITVFVGGVKLLPKTVFNLNGPQNSHWGFFHLFKRTTVKCQLSHNFSPVQMHLTSESGSRNAFNCRRHRQQPRLATIWTNQRFPSWPFSRIFQDARRKPRGIPTTQHGFNLSCWQKRLSRFLSLKRWGP